MSGRAAGAGAGGPPASPGAAGGVGRGRCVHACWRSAEHRAGGSVCGWGTQQPGGGAPLCLRQSESGASAGARRRTHSRAARRARRAPDLEPVQGRCGLGSSSARVVCTCGATRLRIEWSEERWGVVSSVRTFRTGTCRSTVSTASAPPRPAQPPAPHRGAPPLLHTATFDPARPPQPHRASPPPHRLLRHLSSAIAIASMIAAASFPPPPFCPLHPRRRRPLASTTPYSLAPPRPLPPLLSPHHLRPPCTPHSPPPPPTATVATYGRPRRHPLPLTTPPPSPRRAACRHRAPQRRPCL